jgi:nucleoside-diphosphate-sugar epimerase
VAGTAFVTGGSGFIGGALIRRLVHDGWTVRGLARSEASAERVRAAGAEAVPGELDDVGAMTEGARGCDTAFHCAAALGEWGSREDFVRGNVTGTRNALDACSAAGVKRFVHVGTEAALMAGQPLVDVDERAPLRPDSPAHYPATKAEAELAVRAANRDDFETMVVRPRLVWGKGDTTILPSLAEAVRKGRFAWIGGGRHLTSTTHVDNVIEGLVLAAERGSGGGVWFVTDGEPIVFRDFVTELLGTQGIEVPDRSAPAPLVRTAATVSELLWKALPLRGTPPVTRLAYWLAAQQCTIDTSKAREELGYAPVKTREEGMAELRAAAQTERPAAA